MGNPNRYFCSLNPNGTFALLSIKMYTKYIFSVYIIFIAGKSTKWCHCIYFCYPLHVQMHEKNLIVYLFKGTFNITLTLNLLPHQNNHLQQIIKWCHLPEFFEKLMSSNKQVIFAFICIYTRQIFFILILWQVYNRDIGVPDAWCEQNLMSVRDCFHGLFRGPGLSFKSISTSTIRFYFAPI